MAYSFTLLRHGHADVCAEGSRPPAMKDKHQTVERHGDFCRNGARRPQAGPGLACSVCAEWTLCVAREAGMEAAASSKTLEQTLSRCRAGFFEEFPLHLDSSYTCRGVLLLRACIDGNIANYSHIHFPKEQPPRAC